MPATAVAFFTELLTVPFAQNIVMGNDAPVGDLKLDQQRAEILRDRLLSFIFGEDEKTVRRSYALLSFFARECDLVLNTLVGTFTSKIVPILTAVICENEDFTAQCSAFCILSRIIDFQPDAISYVQPFPKFLEAFKRIAADEITTIEQFCLFSAALSFIAVGLNLLVEIPEFQKQFSVRKSLSTLPDFLSFIFNGKTNLETRLESFLFVATVPPKTEVEYLAYSAVLSSPFFHMPLQSSFLGPIVTSIANLVPVHQPALLGTLLALQPVSVLPDLPKLVVLYCQPACATMLSEYILQVLGNGGPEIEVLVRALCDNGILSLISTLICDMGPAVPPPVVLALAQIIMSHEEATELLLSLATEILNSIFSVDSAAETALIIGAHLARISKDFLSSLAECGALNLAERALQSDVPLIRAKALDFVANLCRHAPLPKESLFSVLHSLLSNLIDSDPMCQKLAALAMGNVLFWSPQMSESAVTHVEFIKQLLLSEDRKTVEHAAGLLANIVGKSDEFVPRLVHAGAVEALLKTLETDDTLDGKTIFALAAFCQYDEGRKQLRAINAQKVIATYTSSPNERVQRYAKNLIAALG
jgi:hypothetical protein